MNRTLIDTGFITALVNKRDEYREKANESVEIYETAPLLTTDAVLLEIGNSLSRSYKSEAVEIFEEFLFRKKSKSCGSTKSFLEKPLNSIKLTPIKLGDWLTAFRSS